MSFDPFARPGLHEYETPGAFGGLLLHDDFDAVQEINEMCHRAGIDTISTGTCIAFAMK